VALSSSGYRLRFANANDISRRGSLIMMKNASLPTLIVIAGLGALLASASPARAQAPPATFTVISPIYGQLVRFSMPSNFVVAYENAKGGNYIREAVPKGETVQAWTQMITVTGAKGLAGNRQVTPESFAVSIAAGFKQACPDTFDANPLGATRFGDRDGFVAVAGCGRVANSADKHSETVLIIAVRGSADVYTIQWAERATGAAKPATDDGKWKDRLSKLNPIMFCAIVPGEAAPYGGQI
jgi:hypothetical protein